VHLHPRLSEPWPLTTLARSSSLSRILSGCRSVLLRTQSNTHMVPCYSHQAHPSLSNSMRAEPCIPGRETICTFSLVRLPMLSCLLSLIGTQSSGLGLGAILARVSSVTDSMVEASSLGLADSLTDEERSLGLLYPRIERSTSFFVPVIPCVVLTRPFQSGRLVLTSQKQ